MAQVRWMGISLGVVQLPEDCSHGTLQLGGREGATRAVQTAQGLIDKGVSQIITGST